MANQQVVLFGAGPVGRFFTRRMAAAGFLPVAFADNDPAKQNTAITVGTTAIPVLSPRDAHQQFPAALWVPTVVSPDVVASVAEDIAMLGVHSCSLWEYLPERASQPNRLNVPVAAMQTLLDLAGDQETRAELIGQEEFRRNPDVRRQRPASDVDEVYFPEFIRHLDDERFVDCGAADGDTVRAFTHHWKKWERITAFEPDGVNHQKLLNSVGRQLATYTVKAAVSDSGGLLGFDATGDCSSHVGGKEFVDCYKLDEFPFFGDPTYIKFDIEGSEPAALWGARNLIREHAPVLAVCAYHEPEHLWQLPLLIHALNPDYRLYLRRYMPGTWELVFYAVPPDRIVP